MDTELPGPGSHSKRHPGDQKTTGVQIRVFGGLDSKKVHYNWLLSWDFNKSPKLFSR